MSTYLESVIANQKYQGNVVIKIGASTYFAIREPDSGLTIGSPHNRSIASLILNPTTIDPRKVSTTISSFSFRILDKDEVVTALILGDASNLIGQEVRIYLGRTGEDMAFADYFELPLTYIQKCEHGDNSYNFASTEQTERMTRPIYDYVSALGASLLVGTTIWTMRDDISDFPTSGFLKVDDEFVSYTGVDLSNNRFTGVVRGELNSIVTEHDINTDVILVETITDNPLTILLNILISGGGGGAYDVLEDGLGIDESLIDIDEIEALRDDLFIGHEFTLSLYDIPSALKYIETELLMPCGLRITNSRNSKITFAILDKARFVEEDDVINEDTITKFPKWSIDGIKVTNVIEVSWDYNEGTNQFQERTIFEDATSIATYGRSTSLKFSFKGLKTTLDGEELVEDFGSRLLARLAYPTPEVSLNTQIDKSLQNAGDKAYLVSSKIPAADGTLDFASNLEILSRSINHTTGDVQFKLAFTSYTNIRSGFIPPSDLITSYLSQSSINVVLGRGDYYMVGWYMRLWDEANNVYLADPPNMITEIELAGDDILTEGGDRIITEGGEAIVQESITEDTIHFEDAWATDLSTGQYRIRFADYDDVAESQKRYGFLSDDDNNFDDGKPSYKVTY